MDHPKSTDRPDLAVIGLGNMGAAVLTGALDAQILGPEQVLVCDPNPKRIERFTARGCRSANLKETGRAHSLLVAVKPQVFPEIAGELSRYDGTIITLMAGISTSRLEEVLEGAPRVVRTMPNMPASIGCGATGMCGNANATATDLEFARRLFESIGVVVEVEEAAMHALTATSGSGPAWVFRMVEAWIAAAELQGLDESISRRLVIETLLGSARLIEESGGDVAELRRSVTSKGGTTAAGLAALDRLGFDEAISEAISEATRRGIELERGE